MDLSNGAGLPVTLGPPDGSLLIKEGQQSPLGVSSVGGLQPGPSMDAFRLALSSVWALFSQPCPKLTNSSLAGPCIRLADVMQG